MSRLTPAAFLVLATLALSACKSPEDRAQEYFTSAQALIADGDVDRALVELRNVFQNDPAHREARQLLADTLLARGEVGQAFGHYLRLVEQYPDTLAARQTLSEIAMGVGDWDAAERHGRAAIELNPEAPRSRALELALRYRTQAFDRDTDGLAETGAAALAEIAASPDNLVLRRVAIDHLISSGTPPAAMPHIEKALELEPENINFHRVKLQVLVSEQDVDGTGDQLKTMVALFPDDVELKQALINWFLTTEDLEGAEAFLRAEAGASTEDTTRHMDVVRFLMETQGRDAARAELTALAEANTGTPNADFYRAFLANMDFEDGQPEAAIAALGEILTTAEPSVQTRNIAAAQAQMLVATGERARAEEIVDGILAEDASHVAALKLRSGWLIGDDRPGEAILALRTAQTQAPRDPELMTLLAAAFERDGSMDLAGEQLAQAVEAANAREAESLRYAQFLVNQGRLNVAEAVLRDTRQAEGNRPTILVALARVLLAQENWTEVGEIIQLLETAEAEEFQRLAQQLRAAVLLGQDQVSAGIDILAAQAEAAGADIRPVVAVVVTQIRAGQTEEARAYLDEAMANTPDSPTLRLLSANLNAVLGETAAAEAELRALMAEQPQADLPVRLLYGVLISQGKEDEAATVLEEALAQIDNSPQLLWIQAGLLEQDNRFEEAIDVYQRIYDLNSADPIAANNLASMLSVYREDPESLERAHAIARRLRSQEVPAFQDTYGWIEYRRGNLEVALPYLQAGAEGLPNDPIAQFHLGMVYADLGRTEQAVTQFERALELAGDRPLPQLAVAQSRLEALTSESQ